MQPLGTPFLSRQGINHINLATALVVSIFSLFSFFLGVSAFFLMERSGFPPPLSFVIMNQHREEQQRVAAASHPRVLL